MANSLIVFFLNSNISNIFWEYLLVFILHNCLLMNVGLVYIINK